MKTRKFHKLIGITLLLPFLAWSLTAVFFLLKPGYESAYEPLALKQYPLAEPLSVQGQAGWEEFRYFHSALGEHLLVKEAGRWRVLDARTLQERAAPDAAELRLLLEDAFQINPARYGEIEQIEDLSARTSTGVNIQLDWPSMHLSQEGRDTRLINNLYSIHYLQWTGVGLLDDLMGLAGLALLLYITWTGAQLAFGFDRRARLRAARKK